MHSPLPNFHIHSHLCNITATKQWWQSWLHCPPVTFKSPQHQSPCSTHSAQFIWANTSPPSPLKDCSRASRLLDLFTEWDFARTSLVLNITECIYQTTQIPHLFHLTCQNSGGNVLCQVTFNIFIFSLLETFPADSPVLGSLRKVE